MNLTYLFEQYAVKMWDIARKHGTWKETSKIMKGYAEEMDICNNEELSLAADAYLLSSLADAQESRKIASH